MNCIFVDYHKFTIVRPPTSPSLFTINYSLFIHVYLVNTYTMTHNTKKLRIAMAGGGTGGHVFPIKSLLQFFHSHESYHHRVQKLYRFGSKKSLEEKSCREIQSEGLGDQIKFIPIFS